MHVAATTSAVLLSVFLVTSSITAVYGWEPTTGWSDPPWTDPTESAAITYDYSSGVGTDKWAYWDTDATVPPAEFPPSGYTELVDPDEYDQIKTVNQVFFKITGVVKEYSSLYCKIKINESAADIAKITLEWTGYTQTVNDHFRIYVYNHTASAWQQIGTEATLTETSSPGETVSRDITSNFGDVLDASNYIYVVYEHAITNRDLYTDYVKVDIYPTLPETDITEVSYGNDGVYVYFRVKTAADPEGKYFNIWMDTQWNGTYGDTSNDLDTGVSPDYRVDTGAMIANNTGPTTVPNGLKYWTGSTWASGGDIEIDRTEGPSDLYFMVRFMLDDIGYADGTVTGEDMNLVVVSDTSSVTLPGSGYKDRAPDSTYYTIAHENIPDLPWPLPLVFVPVLVVSVYILWRKKLSPMNRSPEETKARLNSRRTKRSRCRQRCDRAGR